MKRIRRRALTLNKLAVWFLITFACLMPISFIGWLVHFHFIWELGLPIGNWRLWYWVAEWGAVICVGIASSADTWLIAKRLKRNIWTILLLTLTVFWQWFCGAFDWQWFLIHKLKGFPFPSLNQLWDWNPYYWALGINWTTLHHIIYTIILELVLLGIWIIWLTKRRRTKKHSGET